MLHTESLPTHQGIYTPLSQAMTDSESDEEIEIHNATKHQRQRQQLQQQLQQQQQQHQQQLQSQQQQQQLQRNRSRIPPSTLALKSPHTRTTTATRIVGGGSQLKPQQQHTQQQQQHSKFKSDNSSNNSSSYTTNMQNTFRSVMLSDLGSSAAVGGGNVGVEFSNFNGGGGDYDVSADNVAILGNSQTDDIHKHLPMSTRRRCCFIASLLLCLFAVVGFVWLLPCGNADGTGACPAPVDRLKTHNWLNNYTKIELRGGVNVVAGLRAWENNLVFLYRGDVFFPEFRATNHKRNGIISLLGSSGAVAWYDETVDEPVAIDCTLLDVDSNGKPDCLVIDEYGELGVINSASGQWHWRFMEHSARKLDAYDFPLILPDIDGDGVLDILLISSISLEQRTKTFVQQQHTPGSPAAAQLEARNVLRLLSGRRGVPIGDGFRVLDCAQLSRLQLSNAANAAATLSVSYSCQRSDNHTEEQRSKSLAALYQLITNKSLVGQRLLPASKIAQHRRHGQRKDTEAQRNVYSLSGRELTVENRGKCPDCNVTLVLTESRNGQRFTLRNFTNSGMYGMVPAQWHFKNTKMSGFVMKFWKWHSNAVRQTQPQQQQSQQQSQASNSVDKTSNYTNSTSSSSAKHLNAIKEKDKSKDKSYSKTAATSQQQQQQKKQQQQQQQQHQRLKREQQHEFPAQHEEFDDFEHLLPIEKRDTFNVLATKNQRKLNGNSPAAQLMKNYKMQMTTETVILVLFIGADTRIENTSQSNIVQFCRSDRNEMICQPDLINQENSMLIADLDMDGSQELVSYMSTFVPADDDPVNNWKLVSYVRLLRLQSELPYFYEQEKHN
ncbi:uncharacterized protein LOC117572302 [Drosophila albomicans]|uniref:Uncharacterized protein LOC117572302 n=1 Tax=Drosophila albomicans TaxID=7291 RepID=A0A6P8X3Z6_DROAB|nr:uncharacterized protein LOC117572302 [Drosophila albomicans]